MKDFGNISFPITQESDIDILINFTMFNTPSDLYMDNIDSIVKTQFLDIYNSSKENPDYMKIRNAVRLRLIEFIIYKNAITIPEQEPLMDNESLSPRTVVSSLSSPIASAPAQPIRSVVATAQSRPVAPPAPALAPSSQISSSEIPENPQEILINKVVNALTTNDKIILHNNIDKYDKIKKSNILAKTKLVNEMTNNIIEPLLTKIKESPSTLLDINFFRKINNKIKDRRGGKTNVSRKERNSHKRRKSGKKRKSHKRRKSHKKCKLHKNIR